MPLRTWLRFGVLTIVVCLPRPVFADCPPEWSDMFASSGTSNTVSALGVFDDGGGSALYATGYFDTAGGIGVNCIAKWTGTTWSPLDSGIEYSQGDPIGLALETFDDGSGADLYAAGRFTTAGGVSAARIARWDGVSWSSLGTGIDGPVFSLAVFDDGTGAGLYAGGAYITAGGVTANYIARWDGSAWSSLGGGMSVNWFYAIVGALAVHDDGSGPALYAGGFFDHAGGVAANNIARWDGVAWSAVGGGIDTPTPLDFPVQTLMVFDDGTGPALYAGGRFDTVGGVTANNLAKWDGVSWSAVGGGVSGTGARIDALTVFDDGNGPALYAAGQFTTAGAVSANNLARWDGAAWSAVADGLNGAAHALKVFDNDDGGPNLPALYVGGEFTTAGGITAEHIAHWGAPAPHVTAHPFSQSVTAGQSVGFEVAAAGAIPLNYQWYRNGIPLSDNERISGATTAALIIDPVELDDADEYDVLVTNECGVAVSEPAMLTVAPAPTWCLGDMDCSSGAPTFEDIVYFVAALNGEANWAQYYRDHNDNQDPPCPWLVGDYNDAGGVEFGDIVPFANSIGQACGVYVP